MRTACSFLLGLLLVGGLVELGARLLLGEDELLIWHEHAAQLKIGHLADGASPETVIIGNSMAQQGLVPEAMTPVAGEGGVYNAALNGGVPVVMERWLLDEVLDRTEPRSVIWGISSIDLSATYGDATLNAYDEALSTRRGRLADLDRLAARHSRLVAGRSALRDPAAVWVLDAEINRERLAAARSEVGADGERRNFTLDLSADQADETRSRIAPYNLDVEDLAAMVRTIDALTARGVTVTLVELPVPPRFIELYGDGGTGHARFQATAERLADELGVEYLPVSATGGQEFTDADFVDFTHLGPEASQRFSRSVAEQLAG